MPTFRGLPLDVDERTTAFRGLAAIVRAFPDVRRINGLVRDWGAHPDDAAEPPSDRVWWRLSPTNGPSEWTPNDVLFTPILLKVEQHVPGCDAADGYKAWRCLERAVYGNPGDPAAKAAALAALYAVGISQVDVVRPAGGIDPSAPDAATCQRSEGLLRLHVYVALPGA
jgi:hypothetical protein